VLRGCVFEYAQAGTSPARRVQSVSVWNAHHQHFVHNPIRIIRGLRAVRTWASVSAITFRRRVSSSPAANPVSHLLRKMGWWENESQRLEFSEAGEEG